MAGALLAVDAQGFTEAGAWGDVLTLAAQQRGIAGLVIDGAVRDANAIIEMGIPVFSRGICIKPARKYQAGEVDVSISCGCVRIAPGGVLVGDRDGLVAIGRGEREVSLEPRAGLPTRIVSSGRRSAAESSRWTC